MKKPSLYLAVKNELFLLYLRGLRGVFSKHKNTISYNSIPKYGMFISTIYFYLWLKNHKNQEFDQKNNILIPNFIYESRREHYVYWEMSRIARGKTGTFSHCEWDDDQMLLYYIDKQGKQKFEKNLFSRERLDIANNPLFESIMRAGKITPQLSERGNRLIGYHVNLFNRYDLDNYLRYKSITISDVFRGVYHKIWLMFYISNKYRYEHFIKKPDFLYEFEKLKIALNLQGKHQEKTVINYVKVYNYYTLLLIEFIKSNQLENAGRKEIEKFIYQQLQ